MEFGEEFENKFINQKINENRSLEESLKLGWDLLSMLPLQDLDRIDKETLDKYYHGKALGGE